jgi:uncharacterized membrane protein
MLARYLALEFQLGADSLFTAIAPSWNQIGKLGVFRTQLLFFQRNAEEKEAGSAEKDVVTRSLKS